MRRFRILLLVLALQGCTAPALRDDFKGYSEVYGEALDRQMLLNLARLDNGRPPYFIVMGTINANYIFSTGSEAMASATGTTQTSQTVPPQQGNPLTRVMLHLLSGVLGFEATGRASASSQPTFQFIPLNSEAVYKQVLQPVPAEVFYNFFQQGWPIDQLLRVMVEQVEVRLEWR